MTGRRGKSPDSCQGLSARNCGRLFRQGILTPVCMCVGSRHQQELLAALCHIMWLACSSCCGYSESELHIQ